MTYTRSIDVLRARPRAVADDDPATAEDGMVVFAGGELHTLNPTAALIWQRCDGTESVDAIAADLAVLFGASLGVVRDDVVAAVSVLVERGLVELDGADPPDQRDRRSVPAQPVLETFAVCSGCGSGPDYEQHVIIDGGAVVIVVGADAEVGRALDAAFGARALGRRDVSIDRPSYGVVLPRPSTDRGPTDLARLHRGPDVLLRSRDPERVLRALITLIAAHDPPPGHALLEGLAVGANGRAAIVPVPANRVRFERAAARFGLAVSDPPVTMVGLEPATAVVGAPGVIDLEPLRAVAAHRQHRDGEPAPLAWGTYELVAIAVSGRPDAASVVGELGPSVGSQIRGGPALAELLRFIRSVPIVMSPSVEQIAALVATD